MRKINGKEVLAVDDVGLMPSSKRGDGYFGARVDVAVRRFFQSRGMLANEFGSFRDQIRARCEANKARKARRVNPTKQSQIANRKSEISR